MFYSWTNLMPVHFNAGLGHHNDSDFNVIINTHIPDYTEYIMNLGYTSVVKKS